MKVFCLWPLMMGMNPDFMQQAQQNINQQMQQAQQNFNQQMQQMQQNLDQQMGDVPWWIRYSIQMDVAWHIIMLACAVMVVLLLWRINKVLVEQAVVSAWARRESKESKSPDLVNVKSIEDSRYMPR